MNGKKISITRGIPKINHREMGKLELNGGAAW